MNEHKLGNTGLTIGPIALGTVNFSWLTDEAASFAIMDHALERGVNFLVTSDERGGSIVSTETRVYVNDPSALRRFAVYWRVIHPGSDIIRRMWLRAIKRRAEGKVSA